MMFLVPFLVMSLDEAYLFVDHRPDMGPSISWNFDHTPLHLCLCICLLIMGRLWSYRVCTLCLCDPLYLSVDHGPIMGLSGLCFVLMLSILDALVFISVGPKNLVLPSIITSMNV